MVYVISLSVILAAFWLLNSGHYDALILSLGAFSVALTVYISHRMNVIDREGHPIQLSWRAQTYWLWLAWQIVLSNIATAKIILGPKKHIQPVMTKVKATQKTEVGVVTYANSITLTPGTVTTLVEDRDLEVHALAPEFAEDVESGEMDRHVTKMEGLS